jgi:hypothetical protein
MHPTEILHLVRKGYALATPAQVAVVRNCPDLEIEGEWVPRWALEAKASLQGCGCTPEQLRTIFGQGKDRVVAEVEAAVRAGKRAHSRKSRNRYEPSSFDVLTEAALTGALGQHRESCAPCNRREPCSAREELQQELDQLFPADRRKANRTSI